MGLGNKSVVAFSCGIAAVAPAIEVAMMGSVAANVRLDLLLQVFCT